MIHRISIGLRWLKNSSWPFARKLLALVLIEAVAITTMPVASAGASFPGKAQFVQILNPQELAALLGPISAPAHNTKENATPKVSPGLMKPAVAPAKAKPPVRPLVNAQAQNSPGIAVSVGFADGSSASPNFPVPWQGSQAIVFIGGGTNFRGGAIRLDNVSGADLAIDKVTVDLGRPGPTFQLWSNFTIPANGSAI